MLRVLASALCLALAALGARADVVHVNVRAPGGGDGTSWARAFNNLNDALAVARPGDDLWVAGGTYVPSAPAGRDATFEIPDGVRVLGGFAGQETRIDERPGDPFDNPTVLSGTGTLYSVVTFDNAGPGTALDGVTVEGGLADGPTNGARQRGAGIFAIDSAPTLTRILVTDNNSGGFGAGVALTGTSPGFAFLELVEISGNTSGSGGGGIYIETDASLTDCDIRDNTANSAGAGALVAGDGIVLIEGCDFRRNESLNAGGGALATAMTSGTATLDITDSTFRDNDAFSTGGAISFDGRGDHSVRNTRLLRNNALGTPNAPGAAVSVFMDQQDDSVTIENTLVAGNTATGNGAGIAAISGSLTTVNTTVVGNTSTGSSTGGLAVLTAAPVTIANTILWDNAGSFASASSLGVTGLGAPLLNNSIVQFFDALPAAVRNAATDSSGADPLLVDPDGNDNTFGTTDDNVRLSPGSPAIDAGDNLFLSPFASTDVYGQTRLRDDAGTPDTGNAAGFASVVDIGAAEFQGTSAACAADIAPPLGVFDFFDVVEYLGLFDAMDPAADLAAPAGVFDFFDVVEYLALADAC